VDIISTTGEKHVAENMHRKAKACSVMFERLVSHMNESTRIERTFNDKQKVEIPEWV
jgi:hypothetical protein